MIIGICGYGYTGSGAVLDLLKEVESCRVIEEEFMFSYFPDGLEDLEYHLMQQPSRFFSSDIALLRFRELTKKLAKQPDNLYNRVSHGKFGQLCEEYLQNITQATWKGYWVCEPFIAENDLARIKRRILRHIIPKGSKRREKACRDIRFSIQPPFFYEKTEELLKSIVCESSPDERIAINQPYPANAPEKSMRLFGKGAKALIIDRDPRDVYLLCKNHVKPMWVPVNNVDSFITYYRQMHSEKTSNPAIKYLHFEDLIFRYDETKKEIFEFLGLNQEHHKQARKYFDPDVSGRNTQIFRNESVNTEEIKKIEEQLTKYLYHFPETDHEYSKGDIF